MPSKPPRLCACGYRIKAGHRCACERKATQERKARHDRRRPSSSARGYGREWERARAEFLKQYPYCRRCGAPATVVDHIKPHRGDTQLFWDRSNWQPLCARDHNSAKQREERRQPERF